MRLLENKLYLEDILYITKLDLKWEKLCNKTILISGASGLIGSCIIDVIIQKDINCRIIAVGRDENKAKKRFAEYWNKDNFIFIKHNINMPLPELGQVDFIIHAASNTHPIAYATDPIGTILTNIVGTNNLLSYATEHHTERFVFLSSVEIYGENRGDVEEFDEDYCGYINCNTLRAGYPESKRAGEALCNAYRVQKELDIVIPRLPRTYGPTMLSSDSKAISQFIKKGVQREDICLKSDGTQYYSYIYVVDAVSAILTILLNGKSGEAYNVADKASNITLKDLACIIANFVGTKVVYELPDNIEKLGYSKVTKAILNSDKIKSLGWTPRYNIKTGIERTITILSEIWEL